MGSMVMFSSTIIDKIDKRKAMMPVSVCLQSFLDGKKREVYIYEHFLLKKVEYNFVCNSQTSLKVVSLYVC